MKMTVSISLSILLVIIPLQSNAQEEPSAHLFLINGQILEGKIISLEDRIVSFKIAKNRQGKFNKIPFEQVLKLVSHEGRIILADGKFVLTYIGNSSLISRANEAWIIFPINGTNQFGVIPVGVRADSLIYYDWHRVRKAMNIEFIREVSMIRGASVGGSAAKGALIGALSGALLGNEASLVCGTAEGGCPVGAITLVGLIGGLVVGLTIGTIIGSSKGRDRIINLRNLTLPQKKEKLGEEFGFYQDWSPNQ